MLHQESVMVVEHGTLGVEHGTLGVTNAEIRKVVNIHNNETNLCRYKHIPFNKT